MAYDIVGTVFSIILAIWIIMIGPIANMMQRSDQTIQTYAQDAVAEFVDSSAITGRITAQSYREFMRKLDATGVAYDVSIVHSKERVEPYINPDKSVNPDNDITQGKYKQYFDESSGTTITDQLFYSTGTEWKEGSYFMDTGDYLTVQIASKTPTMGDRYLNLIYPAHSHSLIFARHSATVTSEGRGQ